MRTPNNTLVLLTSFSGNELKRLEAVYQDQCVVSVVRSREELESINIDAQTSLLSFGVGMTVPAEILSRLHRPAYNLHAASPEFPGRDPHHFAVYERVKEYGATLHVMTEQVDAGPIVGVRRFPVSEDHGPEDLLRLANEAGFRLLEEIGSRLLQPDRLPELDGVAWGPQKTSREDFQRCCEISPLIDIVEYSHRFRSFDSGRYDNLFLRLHGNTFRIDKESPVSAPDRSIFEEFTETGYLRLLKQLSDDGYSAVGYGSHVEKRHAILRHDVDVSVHRAARIAELEAEAGVNSTYFLNPRCSFYNVFEPGINKLIQKIRNLGHDFGLHFDASAYSTIRWTRHSLERALEKECQLIEAALQEPVRVVSWHNPDQSNLLEFDSDEILGLINTYGSRMRSDYVYCSDSNGYWRFEPMSKVIDEGHSRLHLLTHPAWWTPDPLSPSERIDRAILGRARNVRRDYDEQLANSNRINLKY